MVARITPAGAELYVTRADVEAQRKRAERFARLTAAALGRGVGYLARLRAGGSTAGDGHAVPFACWHNAGEGSR